MVQVSTGPASPTFQAGAFQRSPSSLLGSGRLLLASLLFRASGLELLLTNLRDSLLGRAWGWGCWPVRFMELLWLCLWTELAGGREGALGGKGGKGEGGIATQPDVCGPDAPTVCLCLSSGSAEGARAPCSCLGGLVLG